jgi:hypothetical protein
VPKRRASRDYKAEYARQKAIARAGGFTSPADYRRALRTDAGVRKAVRAARLSGRDRAIVAGLAAHRIRFPGTQGSELRRKWVGQMAQKIRKAGGNVKAFFKAMTSPPRKRLPAAPRR